MKNKTLNCFTLIELLVVISVISILMAMLLPVLRNAKESAKATLCLSNEKQTILLFFSYAGDFEVFPKAMWPWNEGNNVWANALVAGGYISQPPVNSQAFHGFRCPLNQKIPDGWESRLSEFTYAAATYWDRDSDHAWDVQCWNWWWMDCSVLDGTTGQPVNQWIKPLKIPRSPSLQPAIVETVKGPQETWLRIASQYYGMWCWSQGSVPHFRHNKLCNFGFCDGSARPINLNDMLDMGMRPPNYTRSDFYVIGSYDETRP